MKSEEEIAAGVYMIGGPDISRFDDAAVFIIRFQDELVMVDAGAGQSTAVLLKNMQGFGLEPDALSTVILTHCHIDHIGSAPYFQKTCNCTLIAHDLDADAIECGDPVLTAANWYGTTFPPTKIDRRLKDEHEVLMFGTEKLHCLHAPGHTPGSIVVYLDRDGQRILFGQDIHGPFLDAFGSNKEQWRKSMHRLLELEADILCEGHFGIFYSKSDVKKYIQGYL